MDIPNFSVTNKVCLYVITEHRQRSLARMLESVNLSTFIPAYVCIVTPDKDTPSHFEVAFAASKLRSHGVRIDFVGCEETDGLAARKNAALEYMQVFDCEYGLSIDDDMVFDYFAIERMMQALKPNTQLFGVGPVKLEYGGKGLPKTDATWNEKIGVVEGGVWKWGGYRQGVLDEATNEIVVPVEHLAGCYLHRFDPEHKYDTTFDRPVYFMHESDYLYGKPLAVVERAIVHHWPINTGPNLREQYAVHGNHILYNVKYFAQKHGLGEVDSLSWDGFEVVETVK